MKRKLAYVRREHGLSQDELAEFVDISPTELSKIEYGESDGTEPIWTKLSTVLHTDTSTLKEFQQ